MLRAHFIPLLIFVSSCASTILPKESTIAKTDYIVQLKAAQSVNDASYVQLLNRTSDQVIAAIPSVFTFHAIDALGLPNAERFKILVSGSKDTIAVHENASESSPDEQIAIFQRSKPAGTTWTAKAVFPPSTSGVPFGHYGRSLRITDSALYFQILNNPIQSTRFDSLKPVPPDYRIPNQ